MGSERSQDRREIMLDDRKVESTQGSLSKYYFWPHDLIKLYHDRPIYTPQSKINCAGEYDARPRPVPFREQHRKERSPS